LAVPPSACIVSRASVASDSSCGGRWRHSFCFPFSKPTYDYEPFFSHPEATMPVTDDVRIANGLGAFAQAREPRLAIHNLQSSHAGPISLDLAEGECVALVGESGSGKSVFLRMIADLDPCSGEVRLDGVARQAWRASTWRSMVVYQAAEPAWWESTAEAHFSAAQSALARDLLPRLMLKPGVLQTDLALLSTGERQRLALIRSLACKPKVLLLDEPAASLDPTTTLAMESLLQANLFNGISIIIVTHSNEQAERLGRRRLRMVHGQLAQA
jgi:ABC-type iron transport system FetAB ATPase subunit